MKVTRVQLFQYIIFANARKESLMKNKKQLTLLSVILATTMLLGACNGTNSNPSSSVAPDTTSSSSSSSSEAATLSSITVTAPTKVAYTTADTALDLAGMVVTANYSDNSSEVVAQGYTVSQVDFSTPGQKTVTVTYEGKTATFNVTVANQKFTVKFVANGVEVQTAQVEKGQKASYTGAEPTKAADTEAVKYRFTGWDKDPAETTITQDTTFTAQFKAYAAEVMVDDFESYALPADVIDAGWVAIGWSNTTNGWSEDTKAAVSLGTKSVEGQKALRFDAWRNGSWYKIAKKFETNTYTKSVNALKFRLMVPANCEMNLILYLKDMVVGGQTQKPAFYYPITASSGEYVEYTIPLNDSAWDLWNEHKGKSIASVADWLGVHQDDIMPLLSKIEISIKGSVSGNLPYVAFLDSMKFVTVDNPAKGEVETMGQYDRYTGLLADGSTVRIDLGENGNATATVLDAAEQQQQIPGKVTIDANKQMIFTSADNGATLVYTGKLFNGGQQVNYVSATGTLANAVANMKLNAVQVLDNFEQYTADGKSYCLKYDKSQRSGCRGAYYSEYWNDKNTTTSPWGGDKWSLMGGEGDQLKLKQDQAGAHSGKNYVCMKNSQSNGMRYMQWGLFDGTAEQNAYRGSKFSFWAKTNGLVKKILAQAYYQSAPTNETRGNYVSKVEFQETEAVAEWKHYEVDLNPDVVYYGFMFYLDANWKADSYLYVDDIEIYTANPYAKYVAPAELTPGLTYVSNINGLFNVKVEVGADKAVTLKAPGLGMTVAGTYAADGQDIEMTFGQTKYVATLSKDRQSLAFKSVSGTDAVAQQLKNMSFKMIEYADNAETYDGDGKMYYQGNKDLAQVSGARGAYHCDYYTGGTSNLSPIGGNGWSLMGGSGDQLQLDKTDAFDGSQSLKMKFSTAGNMRYLQWGLADGTAVGHTGFNRLGLYMKNPNANAVSIKLYAYHIQKVEPSTQGDSSRKVAEITVPANSDWSFYSLALDASKTYYGYGIYMVTKSATGFLNVDAVHYYNEGANPYQNFLAKKDVSLSGTTNAGAATIKFGDSGKVLLTCAGLSADNVECAYKMYMNGNAQEMVITVGSDTIKGTYAVNAQGVVTFTVTEATGNLAAAIAANTVFANAN